MGEELLKPLASLVGISALAATCRLFVSPEKRSLKDFLRATVLAVFVGGLTGGIVQGYNLSPETQGAIVGVCAFVADDILLGMISVAAWLRENPARLLNIILNRNPSNPQ